MKAARRSSGVSASKIRIEDESGGDRPVRAGAARNRKQTKPRATDQRGREKNRSRQFDRHLGRKPSAAGNTNDAKRGHAEKQSRRAFQDAARHTAKPAKAEAEPTPEDNALAVELAGIAEEVNQLAGMERAGIMADFAARMKYARQHMRGPVLAGIIRGLKDQRSAALADVSRRSASAMIGRLREAQRRHMRAHPKPRGPQGP